MKEKILDSNAQYQAKVEALLRELSLISEERLNKRPADGGWSAIQTAWHLLLVDENSLLYVQKKLGYGGSFHRVGMNAHWRTFMLKIALFLPLKFKAPKTSSGEFLPEYSNYQEMSERWLKARKNWTDFLTQMPGELVDKAVFKHPRAGKIGWVHMLDFFGTHLERHQKQIRRTLA